MVQTCVYNLAMCVQVIKCLKRSLEDKRQHWRWESSDWVAVQEIQHAFPQWGVHQTSMLTVWTLDLETVKQRSHSAAANGVLGSCLDALVHVEFIVQLISHGL